jgi:hypothetical protein
MDHGGHWDAAGSHCQPAPDAMRGFEAFDAAALKEGAIN